ncbi:MAG: transketolase [Synergistaceae bacterium]|jgi:transketolase|nr:transketolase [Synergistaceae bacterium]
MVPDFSRLRRNVFAARRRMLKMYYEAGSGHLGGSLSCLDAMMVLYHEIMTPRDRFILSKGHAAGALYVTLWSKGLLSDEDLKSFSGEGTTLPGHPSGGGIPGLLFPTGSLGHGMPLASGLALAARDKGDDFRVFCLCSDGEWQEGSCWEALIFALHNHLDNLTVLVDQNGLQAFGTTEEVASMSDLEVKLAAFGPSYASVDGHDLSAVHAALASRERNTKGPHFIFLRTRKGRGTHFENSMASHYLPLTEAQYLDACAVLDAEEENSGEFR